MTDNTIKLNWIPADTFAYDGVKLELTCIACPEQYDAFNELGQLVGYLRLRHGTFRVDVPDCGGKTVYEANPKGDGGFEPDEREAYLKQAIAAIKQATD